MIKRSVFVIYLTLISYALLAQSTSLVYPKNNQVISSSFSFKWNALKNADQYNLLVSADPSFNSIEKNELIFGLDYLYTPPSSGKFYWKVYALRNNLRIDSSEVISFQIFSPLDLTNLHFWVRADSGVVLTNGSVNTWTDLSLQNNSITQIDTSRRPLFISNALNNLPVIQFDAVNDKFNTTVDLNQTGFSISSVYNSSLASSGIRMINGTTNYIYGPFSGLHRVFNGGFVAGKPVVVNRYVVHTANSVNDTLNNYVNNAFYGNRKNSYLPGIIEIGRNAIRGNIAEIVITKGGISDLERESIDNYLMDKYAPPINLGADKTVCSFPDSLSLDIDYALDFQWSTGDTTNKAIIDSAGKYYLTITDMFERTSIDSIVFYQDTNNYSVDFDFTDSTICLGDSIRITAGPEQYQYLWSTSETSPSIMINTANNYSVTLTNCFTNSSIDSFNIYTNQPRFSLGSDTIGCFNNLPLIRPDSNFQNVSYLWSTMETVSSIIADTSDNYILTVTDNFQCTYSDSIFVEIDSALINISLGSDTSLCIGNSFGLEITDTSIVSYLWSTGNTNPQEAVDTSGLYKLTVTNNFCQNSDSIQINIQGDAPSANFTFNNLCFKDTVRFVNTSGAPTGDTILNSYWSFGNNVDSSFNSEFRFDSVRIYQVLLEVFTDKGCSDTTSRYVQIDPKPKSNFTVNDRCSKQEISFFENSSVVGGSIVSYRWDFGDTTTLIDTSRNPFEVYTYDTLGNYLVTLEVTTSDGCKDTLIENVLVNPSPNVDFEAVGNCFGDSTSFTNLSSIAQGSNVSFLWLMNGQQINQENTKIKFLNAGSRPLAFIVESDSACISTLIDTIMINRKPTAAFLANNVCEGSAIQVVDQSFVIADSITSYRYYLSNGSSADTSFSDNPIFSNKEVSAYSLKQILITSNGCIDSTLKSVEVKERPNADFIILNNGSGAPYSLEVDNRSTDNDLNLWKFDNGDSSLAELPDYVFQDTGSYNLELIVESVNNCKDSIAKTLRVTPYFLDAAIQDVELFEDNNGFLKLRVNIANLGNNTIESADLIASLNNQVNIQETSTDKVFKGNSTGYLFTSSFLKGDNSDLNFVCVKMGEVNGVEDDVSNNNLLCKEGFSSQFYINLYPNPSSNQVNIDYVLPQDGTISIILYDQIGRELKVIIDNVFSEKGLYSSLLDVSALQSGMYTISFRYNGIRETKTLVVR